MIFKVIGKLPDNSRVSRISTTVKVERKPKAFINIFISAAGVQKTRSPQAHQIIKKKMKNLQVFKNKRSFFLSQPQGLLY